MFRIHVTNAFHRFSNLKTITPRLVVDGFNCFRVRLCHSAADSVTHQGTPKTGTSELLV